MSLHVRNAWFTPTCLLAFVACGPIAEETEETFASEQPLGGFSNNGLSPNGLSANGLSPNGLSANGLSANGLSSNGFKNWFNSNIPANWELMKFIARCALNDGASLTFRDINGVNHTWVGKLGLAPGWNNDGPATAAEQQIVSACLMAHLNDSGVKGVAISLRGDTPAGAIPTGQWEKDMFSLDRQEVFYGNVFSSNLGERWGIAHNNGQSGVEQMALTWGRRCAYIASSSPCGGISNPAHTCTYDSNNVATACNSSWSYPITVYLPQLATATGLPCAPGGCPTKQLSNTWGTGVATMCGGSPTVNLGWPLSDLSKYGTQGGRYVCGMNSSSKGFVYRVNYFQPGARYGFEIRYANGSSTNAQLRFRIGPTGQTGAYTTLNLPPTGNWYTWDRFFVDFTAPSGSWLDAEFIGPASGTAPYVTSIARSFAAEGSSAAHHYSLP